MVRKIATVFQCVLLQETVNIRSFANIKTASLRLSKLQREEIVRAVKALARAKITRLALEL